MKTRLTALLVLGLLGCVPSPGASPAPSPTKPDTVVVQLPGKTDTIPGKPDTVTIDRPVPYPVPSKPDTVIVEKPVPSKPDTITVPGPERIVVRTDTLNTYWFPTIVGNRVVFGMVTAVGQKPANFDLPVDTLVVAGPVLPPRVDTVIVRVPADSFVTPPHDTAKKPQQIRPYGPVELPRVYVNTNLPAAPAPGGRVITVPVGGDLQAALNTARPGDKIELAKGSKFVGAFILPNKGESDKWITITPTSDVVLPPAGVRMTPATAAALQLPRILSNTTGYGLATDLGANHYNIVGIELGVDSSIKLSYGLVGLGADRGAGQTTLASTAHHLILDRAYIHGRESLPLRRCVALNSAYTAVINSWISECHDLGADAQAISAWNSPGPILIENNELQASTENIMFGGVDAANAELSPADVVVRRNHLYKPAAWKDGPWLIKNLFETKNVKRILVEGNVMEGNWTQAWDGVAVALKSVNQDDSAPWSGTTDVTFRYNMILHAGGGFALHASPEAKVNVRMARLAITQNLILGQNSPFYNGSGKGIYEGSDITDMLIDHNTFTWVGGGRGFEIEGDQTEKMVRPIVTNNIFAGVGAMGIVGQSLGWPKDSWDGFTIDGTINRNVFAVGEAYSWRGQFGIYPPDNTMVVNDDTSFAAIGFVDGVYGNVRLKPTSPFKGKATDGTDPGVDLDELLNAIEGVVVPDVVRVP